jgi:hypothetical protein
VPRRPLASLPASLAVFYARAISSVCHMSLGMPHHHRACDPIPWPACLPAAPRSPGGGRGRARGAVGGRVLNRRGLRPRAGAGA